MRTYKTATLTMNVESSEDGEDYNETFEFEFEGKVVPVAADNFTEAISECGKVGWQCCAVRWNRDGSAFAILQKEVDHAQWGE